MRQIQFAVPLTWCSYADERDLRVQYCFRGVTDGSDGTVAVAFTDHLFQTGLENWTLASL
jgi:hypothetical protein